ncbi:MAG: hypothetical protein FWF49_06620, partial [Oscillospiraceae bacterium]|nr:hypothetical protein [Oscillospiraceae bacterium]
SDPTAMKGWIFNGTDPLSMTASSDTGAASWDRWFYKNPLPNRFGLSWDVTFHPNWNSQLAFTIRMPSNPEVKLFMREQYHLDDFGNPQVYIAVQFYHNGYWTELLAGQWYPVFSPKITTSFVRAADTAQMDLRVTDGNGTALVQSVLQNPALTNANFYDATVATAQDLWDGLEYSCQLEGADQDFTLSNIVVSSFMPDATAATTASAAEPTTASTVKATATASTAAPATSVPTTAATESTDIVADVSGSATGVGDSTADGGTSVAAAATPTATPAAPRAGSGIPLWGWVAIGVAAVVIVGGVVTFVILKGKKKKI